MMDIVYSVKRIAERALNIASSSIVWTLLTNSSDDGDQDGAGGWPSDASVGEPDNQLRVKRVESWGVRGRPIIDGVYGLIARAMGGPAANVLVGIATNKYGRQNLDPGETQLYNKISGCEIWLDQNGTLHINASSGQTVIVNGGTLKVARETDPLTVGTLTGTAGPYPVNFVYTPSVATGVGDGIAPGAPVTGTTATLQGVINNTGCAPHFKG